MKKSASPNRNQVGGFSLVELLVVVAIIAIMAAVALPSLTNYLRVYQIRGAAQSVASEIQAARQKAIGKNVNLGVVFVAVSDTQYQWVIEDIYASGESGQRKTVPVLLTTEDTPGHKKYVAQLGPVRQLPQGITFGAGCPGFVADAHYFRFSRLGGWCKPDAADPGCPDLGFTAGVPNYLQNTRPGGGTTVCLLQTTGLTRTVDVTAGGRVVAQP